MAKNKQIREESLKNKIAQQFFSAFDCTDIIKRIDFAVKPKPSKADDDDADDNYLLWAEAKNQPTDIIQMLTQLILTIKADAYTLIPPKFIGCFDNEKIAFVEYHYVLPIFQLNDFNWTQTPSAVDDKTVETVRKTLDSNHIYTFRFEGDETELKNFIKANFNLTNAGILSKLINKNNFTHVYLSWQEKVKPHIDVDWEQQKKKYSIYDRDFFLAELNVDDNGTTDVHDDKTANNNFYITFKANEDKPYRMKVKVLEDLDTTASFGFKKDGLKHYADFWKHYKRPPANEYWNYIVERVDLLVPQDVRQYKGAFFTPPIWVEKSQQYLAEVLGENWQNEYYIWDCCAGTGNMEVGLTNKYNVWASTLDQQDVDVMRERIRNGANLLDNHVFQFDFLNDPFTKCPQGLQDIINDPEKRKKLVIYINPPYAEASDVKTLRKGKAKNAVEQTDTNKKYAYLLGQGNAELYAQFFTRIYFEISDCIIAEFSTLKILQGPHFVDFRNFFFAKLEKMFAVPASTFDNVNGDFPIGFMIWNTGIKEHFREMCADIFDDDGNFLCKKTICAYDYSHYMNEWVKPYRGKKGDFIIGKFPFKGNDFQNQNMVAIVHEYMEYNKSAGQFLITNKNVLIASTYFAVRKSVTATWLNDRDQFLCPNDGWENDYIFQTNCLIWTLFNNNIQSKYGTNHWIPYSEAEVDAKERFESHFMSDFLAGKIVPEKPKKDLFSDASVGANDYLPLQFTPQAQAVLDAGRELWRYYHAQPNANPNASFYDIKEHFQGRSASGRMNSSSDDARYTQLLANLKATLKALGEQIKPKVYEYGFLK